MKMKIIMKVKMNIKKMRKINNIYIVIEYIFQ